MTPSWSLFQAVWFFLDTGEATLWKTQLIVFKGGRQRTPAGGPAAALFAVRIE